MELPSHQHVLKMKGGFMDTNLILLIVLGVIAAVLYSVYVQIIQKKNKVGESLAGIDVQLSSPQSLVQS
jgi:hypothetical protein